MILMVLAMIAHIFFPANDRREEISIRRINGCRIDSSWENLTDTADLLIPRRYLMQDARVSRLQDQVKKGDQVVIRLGYGKTLFDEFSGYVTDVNTEEPVVISCEDEMWKLKQIPVNRSWKKVTLEELITTIAPGYQVDAIDVDLGDIGFERMTVAQVLQEVKDRYNLYSYFKGNTLVAGKVHLDDTEEVTYDFQKNIVGHELQYRSAEDARIKVRAQSIQSDGSTMDVVVGDEDGEESKLVYRNIKSESTLKQLAMVDLERLKVDGYKGSLTAFGIPFCRHGYTAKLINKFHPEREGKYYIDRVVTTFEDDASFRRDVTLGKKAANV